MSDLAPPSRHSALLEIPSDPRFVPLACAAVEAAAGLHGLARTRTLRLVLATEETLSRLCLGMISGRLSLEIRPRATGVDVTTRFSAEALDLSGMSMSGMDRASTGHGDAAALLEAEDFGSLGLLLAARSVDRFRLESPAPGRFALVLSQDRDYPGLDAFADTPESAFTGQWRVDRTFQPEEIARVVAEAARRHPAWELADGMDRPGLVADLVAGGELEAALLRDGADRPGGVIFWDPPSPGRAGATRFHGPYLLPSPHLEEDRPAMARLLCQGMLRELARVGARWVCTLPAVADLPTEEFQLLGEALCPAEGVGEGSACPRLEARGRDLGEDLGASLWAGPNLKTWLAETCRRLALPREILPLPPSSGHPPAQPSLCRATVHQARREAVLHPQLDGPDLPVSIARLAASLRSQDRLRATLHCDLGLAWQARLAESLLAAPPSPGGWVPAFLLPLAGRGDVLVLRHVD